MVAVDWQLVDQDQQTTTEVLADRDFNPSVYDLINDCTDRLGLNEQKLGEIEFWDSAIFTLNMAQAQFVTMKPFLPTIYQFKVTTDQEYIDFPKEATDVVTFAVKPSAISFPYLMSRLSYEEKIIFESTRQGKPYTFLLDKRNKELGMQARLFFQPDQPYEFIANLELQPKTAVIAGNLDWAVRWFNAYADYVTLRLAEKFAPELIPEKEAFYRESLAYAKRADGTGQPKRFRIAGIV